MADDAPDPSRRRFFRSFSHEAVHAAAQVVGTAGALQRGAAAAAQELLGLSGAPSSEAAAGPALEAPGRPSSAPELTAAGTPFRSPYRLAADALFVLDQVQYPRAIVELRCAAVEDVVKLIRARRARGAPLLAQLAAYGIWLAAVQARDLAPDVRSEAISKAGQRLRLAAPNLPTIGWAVARVEAAAGAADPGRDGAAVADAAKSAADALAMQLALDLARLVRDGAAALPRPAGRPLEILTLDATGPLSGGLMGTALSIVQAVAAEDRPVHVWLLETRPYGSGARLGAWELGLAGVATAVVPDGAADWLLARTLIDVVLVGADRVAADGSLTAVIGTLAATELAHRHGVPVWAAAPLVAVDPKLADDAASPVDAADYGTLGEAFLPMGVGAGVSARGPLQDVTPAALIDALVTDGGVLRPPFGPALADALAEAARTAA
ncbi:MAG: hypothetical protein ACXWPV_02000 [Candidatus Limnocylindrales bacterium]